MAYTTIDDPEAFFQVVTYTGNGSDNKSVTLPGDTDMQPDWVWIKNRTTETSDDSWNVFDSPRGVTKVMHIDTTDDEETDANTLDAFESDGFRVDDDTAVNTNAETYVAYCWKAGTTSGIDATGADITPSAYSFNHTSRFSVAAYTGNGSSGAKIAHGLGAIPHLMMIKPRDRDGQAWVLYHHKNTANPETDYLALDATDATADAAWPWNDAAPTSVYLETQTNNGTNASGNTFVLYTFRGVQGFSKFGIYAGTNNVDGGFVHLGFRPAFVLTKKTSAAAPYLWDNKRNGFNGSNNSLHPHGANQENSTQRIDLLSNGFKFRHADNDHNSTSEVHVFWAFAEAPFVNSKGVPCNAR